MRLKTWIRRKLFPQFDHYMETERTTVLSENAALRADIAKLEASRDLLQSDYESRGDYVDAQRGIIIRLRAELGRLRKLCLDRGKLIEGQAQENRNLMREVNQLEFAARVDDQEYEELYDKNEKLLKLFEEPGGFQRMLEEATGDYVWDHWAVKLLVHSFEQTLGDGSQDRVAFLFGRPGTKSCFEVTIHRAETPSIAEKLAERVEVIESLLAILRIHTLGPNPPKGLFTILFNGEERSLLRKAAGIVKDNKPCIERRGSSSNGTPASRVGSASTS